MNTDFRVSVDFFSHHKARKLRRRLGADALLSLLQLWAYAAKMRADGSLAGMDAEDVELAAGWDGEIGVFTEALIEIGFIDRHEGGMVLHDWAENNPWAAGADTRREAASIAGKASAAARASKAKSDGPFNARSTPVGESFNGSATPSPYPSPEEEKDIKAPPSSSKRPPVGAVHHLDHPDLLTASLAEPAPKPKRAPSPSQRFAPPTVDEVAAYCRERNNAVDAEQWHAHYTANGWRVGKNPMRDWRAAVRTWERGTHATPRAQTRDGPPMPRTYRELQDYQRRMNASKIDVSGFLAEVDAGNGKQADDLGSAANHAGYLLALDG